MTSRNGDFHFEDDYFGPIPRTDEELDALTGSQLWDVIEDLQGAEQTPENVELRTKISQRIGRSASSDNSYEY